MIPQEKCETQLSLDFGEAAAVSDRAPESEPFLFLGKSYHALIAPYFGCHLMVRPDHPNPNPKTTGKAMRAFLAQNRDRIELICRKEWTPQGGRHDASRTGSA